MWQWLSFSSFAMKWLWGGRNVENCNLPFSVISVVVVIERCFDDDDDDGGGGWTVEFYL